MQELKLIRVNTRILTKPQEILKQINNGVSIPILPKFHKYILNDIQAYNAKAIVLEEELEDNYFDNQTDNIVGFTLIYDDGSDVLYFGFFNVYDHDAVKIQILIEELIRYAEDNDFRKIRGPINVPTMIFGWGFIMIGENQFYMFVHYQP